MNKLYPKKAKDIKGAVAIAELKRAHYIIVVLALSFAAMIAFVSTYEVRFDAMLGLLAALLLLLVAGVSFWTIVVLSRR